MGKNTTEEKIKKIAKDVTDAATPIIKEVKEVAQPYIEKAQPYIEDIKSKADPVAQDVLSKAQPVYEDIKHKAEPVLNIVKEKAAPATEAAGKAAKDVRENISKQAARYKCKEEVYIQYNQHEVRTTDIMDRAKSDYVSKGNKITDIKEIQVYVKPTDNAVYYVVNHSQTGKIEF
ncbi:MAG: hypothetical protein J6N21_14600 [Butyrivibrio sp.]|nr:hypothetical protein [Butyrivibrio sp.]MBP3198216.1 hypothetical protein [Butyrivibrio sp.]